MPAQLRKRRGVGERLPGESGQKQVGSSGCSLPMRWGGKQSGQGRSGELLPHETDNVGKEER